MRLSPPKVSSRIFSVFSLGLAYLVPIMVADDSSATSRKARAVASLAKESSLFEYGLVILFVAIAVLLFTHSVSSWTWLAVDEENVSCKSWMTLFRIEGVPVASLDSFGRDESRPKKVKVVIGSDKKVQQKINYLLTICSYDPEKVESLLSGVTGKVPGFNVSG